MMRPTTVIHSAALGLLVSSVSAGFNAASSSNVAIYWGQGDAQITLTEACNDESVDIVNIAFVNGFPTQVGDYPATNFANACGDSYFSYADGTKSKLLSSCPSIEPGITACQANGKKVLLSLGGGWPTDYYLPSKEVAEYFAEFLWGAFGPPTTAWSAAGKPRPFGDASVDGFDLDIESYMVTPPFAEYQYANYEYLIAKFKNDLFPSGPGTYYISGAPQCVIPDARLASAISLSHFDFVFVQFYNTPECSTRAGYDGLTASSSTFTFDAWAAWLKANSFNKNAKLYLGMPANVAGAPSDPTSYLTPTEANKLISHYKASQSDIFGGVMLWEASVSSRNTICSKSYSKYIKDILSGSYVSESCTSSSASSSVASSTATSASASSSSPVYASPTGVSTGGSCGPNNGQTCRGSAFGDCCSAWGYCGSTEAYCGANCDSKFGKCGTSSSSSSAASSTSSSISSSASSSSAVSSSSSAVSSSSSAVSSSSSTASSSSSAVSSSSSSSSSSSASSSSSTVSSSAISSSSSATSSSSSSSSAISSSSSAVSSSSSSSSSSTMSSSSSAASSVLISSSSSYPANSISSSSSANPSSSVVYGGGSSSASGASSSTTVSSSSVPYVPNPSGSSSSVSHAAVSSSSSAYPAGSSSSSTYPAGESSSILYGSGSSSGIVYPSGSGFVSYSVSTPSTSSHHNSSSTPCTTSSVAHITPSSSVTAGTRYNSSAPEGVVLTSCSTASTSSSSHSSSSSTPCSTSKSGHPAHSTSNSSTQEYQVPSSTPGSGYPLSSSASEGFASSASQEHPVYTVSSPAGLSVSSKPGHSAAKPTPVTTTVYTTTYVDICPTGFTTLTTMITKTVCPACATPTPKIPEGWTTTVAVCGHCGPKTTTVTLTKPIHTRTASSHYVVSSSPAVVVHAWQSESGSAPAMYATKSSHYIASSSPAAVVYPSQGMSDTAPAVYPTGTANVPGTSEDVTVTSQLTSKIYITLTAVATPATAAPYSGANSTDVYAPSGTGSSYGPGQTPSLPATYEGAAGKFSIGGGAVVAIVAGLLAL